MKNLAVRSSQIATKLVYKSSVAFMLYLLFSIFFCHLQAQVADHFECSVALSSTVAPAPSIISGGLTVIPSSTNGGVFTPIGDIKVLIVFAGFTTNYDDALNYPNLSTFYDNWEGAINESGFIDTITFFPDSIIYIPSTISTACPAYVDPLTGAMPDLFFSDNSEFTSNPNSSNISNYFYVNSHGKLRLIADVFRDPTGKPVRVNIDPTGASVWANLNAKVIEQMKVVNPTFDWSIYDNRTNWPYYAYDNSTSSPDMKPDYVVVCYRYIPSWETQPVVGMNAWPGSGGAYSLLDGTSSITYNGYTFDGAGFTGCTGLSKGVFIHELAHVLINCQHYCGANSAQGGYYNTHFAHSMMATIQRFCANAWEKWYMGWTELVCGESAENADIRTCADIGDDGLYTLRDFVTTGDALRIAIPYSADATGKPQYLWLENHQKINTVFDESPAAGTVFGSGAIMGAAEKGLIAYVTDLNDRESTDNYTAQHTNALKLLNAAGNWDYRIDTSVNYNTTSNYNFWETIPVFEFSKIKENPISGNHPTRGFKYDADNNGTIVNIFNYNGGGAKTEYRFNTRETYGGSGVQQYRFLNSRNADAMLNERSNLFQVGDEISISGLVPALKMPMYDGSQEKFNKTFINGLKIEVVSQNEVTKAITIKITCDDWVVRNTKNWCGNISVPANETLTIDDAVNIYIDKSETNERKTKSSNNDFLNNTHFNLESNAKIVVKPLACLVSKNSSTIEVDATSIIDVLSTGALYAAAEGNIIVRDGGQINLSETNSGLFVHGINANVTIEQGGKLELTSGSITKIYDGGTLELDADAIVNLAYGAKIIIEDGGTLLLHGSDDINLQWLTSAIEIKAGGTLKTDAGIDFAPAGVGIIHFYAGGHIKLGKGASLILTKGNSAFPLATSYQPIY